MTPANRILGAVRLSVFKDETTSPTRQREAITGWAASLGSAPVGWAEDLNVSASKVGPFQRPELGAWLTDRTDEFDTVCWWRLDRAVRSMADLHELAAWARNHGKRLAFASGPTGGPMVLDMSDPVSELIVTILAFAAQMEAQAISERVTSAQAYLRSQGRWGGGTYPYGTMPVETADGWRLVSRDPVGVTSSCSGRAS
jgi:DNA invertase Pin-like site-specific DNA recombinase